MKPKIRDCVCRFCNASFKAADVKASVCDSCKTTRAICSDCGKKKSLDAEYCQHCSKAHTHKGKSYIEIYGTETPGCGHRAGAENYNFAPGSREKRSAGMRRTYENNPKLVELRREQMKTRLRRGQSISWTSSYNAARGERYQSKLEEQFATKLQELGINYEKDYSLVLRDVSGAYLRTKLVDFVLANSRDYLKHFVEISGFAYPAWQTDFIKKMGEVFETLDDQSVVIFTYRAKLEELQQQLAALNKHRCILTVGSVEDNMLPFLTTFYREEYENGTSDS